MKNFDMTPRLSDHFSTFGLVFFVLKSLLGIARQWSREKFAILILKPRSHVRIVIYRKWSIIHDSEAFLGRFSVFGLVFFGMLERETENGERGTGK